MGYGKLIEYTDASPEARAVMDDIKRTRGVPDVNNAWKAMARHPEVAFIDLRPALRAAKTRELVYYKTDSHWNYNGAVVGYEALMAAVPIPDPALEATRPQQIISGEVPSALRPPPGCRFHPRCPIAKPHCAERVPEWREVAPSHWVACHEVK